MTQPIVPPRIDGLTDFIFLSSTSACISWRASQIALEREVEVRQLREDFDAKTMARIAHVAKVFAKMSHPSILQVYDIREDASPPYLVHELAVGKTLHDSLKESGRLAVKQTLEIARQIAEAAAYIDTQAKIVLRNLKPQNITITPNGTVKITDFSNAVIVNDLQYGVAVDGDNIVGTPGFISPEQTVCAPHIDSRSDMYALGALIYNMLLGKTPFEDLPVEQSVMAHLSSQIQNPRALDRTIPLSVSNLVTRLMMKSPEDRYATWPAVVAEIRNIISGRPASPLPQGTLSTVETAPAQPVSTANAQESAAQPKAAERVLGRRQNHRGVHPILWIMLGLWFLWLINCRMGNPAGLPDKLAPQINVRFLDNLWKKTETPQKHNLTPIANERKSPPAKRRETSEEVANTTDSNKKSSAREISEIAPPENKLGWKNAFAEALEDENIDAARKIANEAAGSDENAAHLAKLLKSVPDVDRSVGDAIMKHRNESFTLTYNGKVREFNPVSLTGTTLKTLFTLNGVTREVDFKISALDATEKLRILSSEAQSAEEHAAAAAYALELGENTVAIKHFKRIANLHEILGN